jgi:AcrR family transcriptional regulator
VAARAAVSHGTVLFHFHSRDALVQSLLQSVLETTAGLPVPAEVDRLTRPAERLQALLRSEMKRLSGDPRQFRLFLEYWALGVRNIVIRRRVIAALDNYRRGFRAFGEAVTQDDGAPGARAKAGSRKASRGTAEGLAAVAVSLVHGCALQAAIDPKTFSVQHHFETAARLLDGADAD